MQIRQVTFPADGAPLKAIILDYVAWLDMDLSYRGFDEEMDMFEPLFTLPSGLFLVAEKDGELAGCVGLLRHDGLTAEVKRLYVRPEFRGLQLGEKLVRTLIRCAITHGFVQLILDAVPQTVMAQNLYRALGFQETAPYYANPVEGTKFFALTLA